jgi:8-oxo-dGTP pyrophosphatase MutT (NUDIX family)
MAFERIDSREIWGGKIARVRIDRIRYDDGDEAEREVVEHPGAVTILAHDDEVFYMVEQPREPVGEQALLELPAGKLDEEGEGPLATAKRELAEEIGKGARTWKHLATFWGSPGFSTEQVHLFLATDLYDQSAEAEENERIVVHDIPLSKLDDTIGECRDSKSLVGLLWLKAYGDGTP